MTKSPERSEGDKLSPFNYQLLTTKEIPMSRKTMNLILILAGALLTIISLLADVIGIGSYPGINWAQIIGAGAGLVVVVLGILRSRLKIED